MAESLKSLYTRHTWAESVFVYSKAIDNMRDPTMEEYNSLPPDIKSQYPTYGSYVTKIQQDNAVTKQAIKDKIQLLGDEIDVSEFTTEEKNQYKKDIKDVKDKCDSK